MIDKEIKTFINKCLDERFSEYKKGYMRRLEGLEEHIRKKLDKDYGNVLSTYSNINSKVHSLELSFQSLQIGLNNVYEEFKKLPTLEDIYELGNADFKLIKKISSIIQIIEDDE